MENSLVEQAFNLGFLLSPCIESLIKNFSFRNEFLSFCSTQSENANPIISWSELKVFFDSNKWNWKAFIQSNIQTILFENGFLLSSDIKPENMPITDIDQLLPILQTFSSSKVIFDQEMLSSLQASSILTSVEEDSFSYSSNDSDQNISDPINDGLSYVPKKEQISSFVTIITNDLNTLDKKISSLSFQKHFENRFLALEKLVIENNQEIKNRPKFPKTSKDIELNERIFITGLVTQTDLSNTQLYSTKLQLENFSLNCSIIVSISINQQSKIPIGIVLGIIGKVTDLENLANGKVNVIISAENWFYPGINPPLKKPLPKTTNESWVVVIGSIDFSNTQHSSLLLNQFVKWLQKTHENFRVGYCIFNGGILAEKDFESYIKMDSDPSGDSSSLTSKYDLFHTLIEKIPSKIQIFIVPSPFDATNQFLPQPSIISDYHSSKKNIHYLQNPNIITLEKKNLLLYNPIQFYSLDQFQNQPEKFGIELLNLRHLCPIWDQHQKTFYPYSFDTLIIPDDIDFFVFSHPSQSVLSNYKNINILSVNSNSNDSLKEFHVTLFNLHTQERNVMAIPLDK